MDYFGTPDHHAVLALLDELGIVYTVDWKAFRGACDGGLGLYRAELNAIAAASQGHLTITDIARVDDDVTDDDGEHVLRFRCNGVLQEWRIAHSADENYEDFDAQLTFGSYVSTLTPSGSPLRWCTATSESRGEPLYHTLANPHALRQLGAQFGLTFHAP